MKAVSAVVESCCVYDKAQKVVQQMHGIIPYLLDCWADPVVHLPSTIDHLITSLLHERGAAPAASSSYILRKKISRHQLSINRLRAPPHLCDPESCKDRLTKISVVVAQLIEQSLPIPEVSVRIQSSAKIILSIYCQLY